MRHVPTEFFSLFRQILIKTLFAPSTFWQIQRMIRLRKNSILRFTVAKLFYAV
jgi:hypothetical protein